ncbi:MAG: N-acetyltransferase family protein [Pseudobdellovibrio sp.]
MALATSKVQPKKFSVRQALLEDAPAIGAIHAQSWKTTYKGIIHQSFLDSIDVDNRIAAAVIRIKNPITESIVLVDEETKKVVGFTDVGPCREKNVDADGELHMIYLFKEYQGLGGGKLLFHEAVKVAKEKGYKKMMVSVLAKNIESRRFYEKMGAEYIGEDHVDIEKHRYPTSTYLWRF